MGHVRKHAYKVKVSNFVRLRKPNASDRPFGAVRPVILLMTELFTANWIGYIYCPVVLVYDVCGKYHYHTRPFSS